MRMFLLVAVRSIFHGALFLLDLLESLEFQSRLGKAAEFSGVEWISNLMAWGQTLGHLIWASARWNSLSIGPFSLITVRLS